MGMDSFQESSIRSCHWVSDTCGYMERYVGVRVSTYSASKSSMGCLWRMREVHGYWSKIVVPEVVSRSMARQRIS
jgi:hypothetical protein